MKRRLVSLTLCFALAVTLCTGALAADPASMEDITNHWARESIGWGMNQGLFQGVSETEFAPDGTMTRGMFVTALGRLSGVDMTFYENGYLDTLYTDVSAGDYYAASVNWATRCGIVNGRGDGSFAPADPITREQMAAILIRYASNYNFILTTVSNQTVSAFSDGTEISEYAVDAVESLRSTGILTGFSNDDGTYAFRPGNSATRAECAVVFERLYRSLEPYAGRTLIEPTDIYVLPGAQSLSVGQSMNLTATVLPENASNKTVTWVSTDPSVIRVDHTGQVKALSVGTATVYGYTWNGEYQSCVFTSSQDTSLAYEGETYQDKCVRIFGQVVDDPRTYYDSAASNYEKATEHLVTVAVNVWDFTDYTYTTKYTKTIYLQVHENIAETVKAIFAEIYAGDEQFPISSAGGYYVSTVSEHHPGLAIDINPNSNYYCDPNGNAITGSHWDPENDPYSIPLEGDVVDAFTKYGFTRGIYWRSGYKDYMHFSYFAT